MIIPIALVHAGAWGPLLLLRFLIFDLNLAAILIFSRPNLCSFFLLSQVKYTQGHSLGYFFVFYNGGPNPKRDLKTITYALEASFYIN